MLIKTDLDLVEYNSYGLRSIAKRAFFPSNENELKAAIECSDKYIVIGGGCNIILSKAYYDDLDFIFIRDNYSTFRVEDTFIYADAGVDLKELSLIALKYNLSGLEYFYDIPGCVGGAVVMNAGCKDVDFSGLIKKVFFYDVRSRDVKSVSIESLEYEYRNGFFQKNKEAIILSVKLELERKQSSDIEFKMIKNKEERWKKQPREYPSAGSVFKRPNGCFVGTMIEQLNLKGFSVGGAEISEKHAGFIVNKGNATGEDILSIVDVVKEKVFEKYGILLELEQQII